MSFALGTLGLVLLVGPLALGGPAKRAYQDLLGDLLAALPTGWVILEHYDRGWFSSSASAELTLQPSPSRAFGSGPGLTAPLHIRLDSRIEQGPLAWLSPVFPPVLARVSTRVELVEQPMRFPPLALETDLYTDGGAFARLRVPAGEHPGLDGAYRVRNGELAGSLRYIPHAPRLRLDLTLPDLALSGPAGPVASLAGLSLAADLVGWIDGLYAGQASLALDSAGVGPRDSGAAVDGLTLQLEQTPAGSRLGLQARLDAASARLGGRSYRKARIRASAEDLDGAVLAELVTGLRAISAADSPRALRDLALGSLLARVLPRLADTGPRLAVDPVGWDAPEGPVAGRLSIAMGSGPAQSSGSLPKPGVLSDPGPAVGLAAWLRSLEGEGEIALPRSTAESLALAWLPPPAPGPDPGPSSSPGRLAGWIADGWIADRGDRLATGFRLADGLLSINGKTIPLLGASRPAEPGLGLP